MTAREILNKLEGMGTAQNRKVYARHGVTEPQYGVSYANLRTLGKKIKTDHGLARELWATGNHDARILATIVADPEALGARELDTWSRELDNYVVTDAFAAMAARSSLALKKIDKWSRAKGEWVGRAGYKMLAHIAMKDGALPDVFFDRHLAEIETSIHTRKNRVRDAMNGALIAIGLRSSELQKKAVAAAKRIGKVEVDHGETGCKTPNAADYIRRAAARKKKAKK
jgi:3-methyladenine DNA glycosylase AlkD